MNINSVLSAPSGEVMAAYLRVKLNGSGQAVLSDVEAFLGTNLHDVAADPDEALRTQAAFQLKSFGAHYAIAADAVGPGGEIEAAADGKVKLLAGGTAIGVFFGTEGASPAGGGQIRVIYY